MTRMCKTPSILSYFGLKEQTYKTTSGQRKSRLEARNKQIEEMKGEEVQEVPEEQLEETARKVAKGDFGKEDEL